FIVAESAGAESASTCGSAARACGYACPCHPGPFTAASISTAISTATAISPAAISAAVFTLRSATEQHDGVWRPATRFQLHGPNAAGGGAALYQRRDFGDCGALVPGAGD